MSDLHKALSDIGRIRQQLAAGTMFRGFGPTVIGLTGALAVLTATAQWLWFSDSSQNPLLFIATWIALAVLCAVLIGIEMWARTHRHHQGLEDAMLLQAVQQFLPVGVAGLTITIIVVRYAIETAWMLPGLWQILLSVGLFASLSSLPQNVSLGAAWYLLTGSASLILLSETRELSPWAMGVPFGIGQILLAFILHFSYAEDESIQDRRVSGGENDISG